MKKIVKISLKNFKAYLTLHDIELPNGENLLVYGENGSGKSSFVKAIMHYLQSSVHVQLQFLRNIYQPNNEGYIKLSFVDYDVLSKTIKKETLKEYTLCSNKGNSDNCESFIKDAFLTTGYLDYLSLLQVYLIGDDKVKFFNFLVLDILGGFISLSSGASHSFRERWDSINNALLIQSYTRNTNIHKAGKKELNLFEADLRKVLDAIFVDVNSMLSSYFPHFGLTIQYELEKMNIKYGKGGRANWKIGKGVRLKVSKDGIQINNYRLILNEARLSAISICLYLSSLKQLPVSELRLLLLDDVFIGIDTSNRLPFLRLLNKEFNQYQIILLTYDRNWYNLARTYLASNVDQKWITKEIYNGETQINGNTYFDPLVIEGLTSIEKARSYLYSRDHPDYPASANYFRKAIEEILSLKVPKNFMKNADSEQVGTYKLTLLVNRLYGIIANMTNFKVDLTELLKSLDFIKTMLAPLIHPLSHFADNEAYRSELIELDHNVTLLEEQLEKADLASNTLIIVQKNSFLKFGYSGDSSWHFEYIYEAMDNALIYKDNNGSISLSPCVLNIHKMIGTGGEGKTYDKKVSKNSKLYDSMKGSSIEERVQGLFTFIKSNYPQANFSLEPDYINHVWISEDNDKWIELSNKVNHFKSKQAH